MSLARATLTGVVASEPEKRFTPNNFAVTNFTLSVSPSSSKDSPFFVRVTCWRNLADVVAEQIHKGMEITVEGKLQVNQYEASGGLTKRIYEVDASNVFIGKLQPMLVGAEQGGNGGARRQQGFDNSQAAGYANPMGAAPQQQAPPYQSMPAGVPQGGGMGNAPAPDSFFQDELLTEDDIPF